MEPITLTTDRLVLRPFEERDVERVHHACQDPEILRWIPVPNPYRLSDAEEFVRTVSPEGWKHDTLYNFGVFTRDGRTLVGSMGLSRLGSLGLPDRTLELGFWTAREQRRRGYTVEAGRAVAHWAFTQLGAERLEWLALVGNEPSRAAARRMGFVMEGTQRSRAVHRGNRRDAWVAALLPSDLGLAGATPYLPARERELERPATEGG
ncbi:GNAT family N-acetyltransferase [Streptomyces sp. NPDC005438]|uniref:GNAT family N-acetyltransferase n=1 Tax=Streptomyces sp. NPDC005438 TaxID=3156880 RepID=UPI0033B88C9D